MKVPIDSMSFEYLCQVNVKKLSPDASLPKRGSASAAGYDLCAHIDVDEFAIEPGATVKIGTGIAMSIPHGYFGAVCARSGLATKKGLRPANCIGVIDEDYTGEIIVALHNDSEEYQTITNGERIAQLIIMPYLPIEFIETDSLDRTERGDGGFGSSGAM